MKKILFSMGLLLINGCSQVEKMDLNSPPLYRGKSTRQSLPAQPLPQIVATDNQKNQKTLVTHPVVNETKTCANYELPVKQAVQANDLDRLDDLLFTLNRESNCPVSYLEAVKRSMAQIAAARADDLTQQGQLTNAESWLRRAPTMVWGTQVVHGDIAARRHQWQNAARFYNQAIDLMADTQATPQAPSPAVIKKVYRLAYEAQLLAGHLGATIDSSGMAKGAMRDNVRGIEFKKRPIPLQFGIGQITLNKKNQESAQQLATYFKRQNVDQVTLIGHTDSKGNHTINDKISKQRALMVKKYLQQSGVVASIIVIGKGEKEPLQLANLAIYTPDEIDTLNRRVEFFIQ